MWGKNVLFFFNKRTKTIDFSVYREKGKTTQAKSSLSSPCFKYGMWLGGGVYWSKNCISMMKPESSPTHSCVITGTSVEGSPRYRNFSGGGKKGREAARL